ncbi:MAG: exodeoxyribonuclease III [Actinomycetia bacterium]|nr:exodeoxyribonuclease III [Actinomycetes bacterium]
MLLISWNVNGIRASLKKGFLDFFTRLDADAFCLNETKVQAGQVELELPGYRQYWSYAEKKGYSGTAVFSKTEPISVREGIGVAELDREGRVTAVEYPDFWLISVYTPNAQDGLARIDHRMAWEDAFRKFCRGLDRKKPVIICGDMNVAHEEIDLARPKPNRGNAGFSDEERGKMTELLSAGFIDTYRHLYPDTTEAYTWWSFRANARARNVGWRIDYFLASKRLESRIADALIYPEVEGSDHCPIGLLLKD